MKYSVSSLNKLYNNFVNVLPKSLFSVTIILIASYNHLLNTMYHELCDSLCTQRLIELLISLCFYQYYTPGETTDTFMKPSHVPSSDLLSTLPSPQLCSVSLTSLIPLCFISLENPILPFVPCAEFSYLKVK